MSWKYFTNKSEFKLGSLIKLTGNNWTTSYKNKEYQIEGFSSEGYAKTKIGIFSNSSTYLQGQDWEIMIGEKEEPSKVLKEQKAYLELI